MFHESENGAYTQTGDSTHRDGYWLWFAFIVFIIFAIFAFVFMKNDKKHDGCNIAETLTPLIAAKAMNGCGCGCNDGCHSNHNAFPQYIWDNTRDNLKEFGKIEKEIVVQTLGQSREFDSKFHEVLRKQSEDTASIKSEMNARFFELAKENWMAENMRLRDELMKKEINHCRPAFAYSPPAPIPGCSPCGAGYPAYS